MYQNIRTLNIFVKNLSPRTNEAILEMMFSNYGEVDSVKIIYDRITRESRCFGFIEMPNDDEALKAIAGLNESSLDEYTISVSEAEPPKKKFKIRF